MIPDLNEANKKLIAILAGFINQNKSVQPSWVKHWSQGGYLNTPLYLLPYFDVWMTRL